MANRYIVWRKVIDPMVGEDPLVWEGSVFFQLWSRRVPPFGTLAEGDTVYLWDRSSNRIVWEWRIRCLLRTQYESRDEVFAIMNRVYGLDPEDLNLLEYVFNAPSSGFILAWSFDVVAALDIEFPKDFKVGDHGFRSGYVPVDAILSQFAGQLSLPNPGRPATVFSPPFQVDSDQVVVGLLPRHIPAHVRQHVLKRDQFRCVVCHRGRPEVALHIDHIRPYSRGGGATVDNLQVLCAPHNLSKNNKILGAVPAPVWSPDEQRERAQRLATLHAQLAERPTAAVVLEVLALQPAMSDRDAVVMLQPHVDAPDPTHRVAVRWELLNRVETDGPRYWELLESVHDSAVQPWASRAAAYLAEADEKEDHHSAIRLAEEALSRSDEPEYRALAATTLLVLGDREDKKLLRILSQSPDPDMRAAGAWGLVELDEPDALDLARSALATSDAQVRLAAFNWLQRAT